MANKFFFNVSSKMGINDGFSLNDLKTSFFGSHVQKEPAHYPALEVGISKTSLQFCWMPKKIKLVPCLLERKGPTDWRIEAKILNPESGEDDGLLKFDGEYSTRHRIGAGTISIHCLVMRDYNFGDIVSNYLDLEYKKTLETPLNLANVMMVAYMLWYFGFIAEFSNNKEKGVMIAYNLQNMTSDYRSVNLTNFINKLVKKIKGAGFTIK